MLVISLRINSFNNFQFLFCNSRMCRKIECSIISFNSLGYQSIIHIFPHIESILNIDEISSPCSITKETKGWRDSVMTKSKNITSSDLFLHKIRIAQTLVWNFKITIFNIFTIHNRKRTFAGLFHKERETLILSF